MKGELPRYQQRQLLRAMGVWRGTKAKRAHKTQRRDLLPYQEPTSETKEP